MILSPDEFDKLARPFLPVIAGVRFVVCEKTGHVLPAKRLSHQATVRVGTELAERLRLAEDALSMMQGLNKLAAEVERMTDEQLVAELEGVGVNG